MQILKLKKNIISLLSIAVFGVVAVNVNAEDNPVIFDITYTGEAWTNTQGGIKTGTSWLSNLDMSLEAQVANGTLFIHALYNNNSQLSEKLIGDVQAVSNIDNTEVFRLYEAWYSHDFAQKKGSIKVGLIDLNSEFDAIDSAGYFINSSHGIGPEFSQTGENGPSIFPSTSLAVRIDYAINDEWQMRIGVFDAVPNDPGNSKKMDFSLDGGTLLVGEANYTNSAGTRFGLGSWLYTSNFETILPVTPGETDDGNRGSYAFVEGTLIGGADQERSINGWLRFGLANNTDINFLKSYFGGGLLFQSFISQRPNDRFGLAFATAYIGNTAKRAAIQVGETITNAETTIELFYEAQVNEWLTLKPDIQYVKNPGITGNLDNALVIGMRFEISNRW